MAIRRFVARRGAPVEIYSDNGTNFQGASNDLKQELAVDRHQLAETFTNATTKWNFNPPSAPHMGGAWERLVRSVKAALANMETSRHPNEETLATVVTEAEAIVNSRPLTYISLKFPSQEALTPNHFLLLSSSGVVQTPKTIAEAGVNLMSDWNLCRVMVDQYWRRWIREYLPTIACRTKWLEETKPIEPGCLVILVGEGTRNSWIRGRVLSVIKGSDGRCRQAVVQTPSGLLRRPVSKLARLEVEGGNPDQRAVAECYGSGNVAEHRASPVTNPSIIAAQRTPRSK